MAKTITFSAITEAAKWDDPTKKKIDARFVSFDKDEAYEPEHFVKKLLPIIQKQTGKDVTKDELLKVLKASKDKVAHNHPRKALLKQVLKHYDIDLTD